MQRELKNIDINKLVPYENNPRNNDEAVDAVAESIKQCEYITPIIVDEDLVVLAGHTRLKALKKLKHKNVDVEIISGLTEEQKRKFRILDNKTNELAGWDFTKLEAELEDLDFGDFDFGFSNNSIDIDSLDDLFTDAVPKEKEPKRIQCPHCGEWFEE